MCKRFGRTTWLPALGALILVAGIAWSQHMPLLRWYYLRALADASEESRASWVERAASLDTMIAPGLLELLQKHDPISCINAEHTLTMLVKRWGPEDTRTLWLADEMRERFSGLSPLGRISALQVMTVVLVLDGPLVWPASLTRCAGDLVQASRDRPELRGTALPLASALLDRVPPGQWLDACRTL